MNALNNRIEEELFLPKEEPEFKIISGDIETQSLKGVRLFAYNHRTKLESLRLFVV